MANFNELINDKRPVLIDFYADWCQPCKMVTPILKNVKQELGDKVKIVKINVDKNPAISARYGIRNIPTLMLFKSNQLIFKKAGIIPEKEIKNLIVANS